MGESIAARDPLRVGVIGCGNISGVYLRNLALLADTRVVACADLDGDRARRAAADFDIPRACSVDELLGSEEVEAVLNLTVPAAHADLNVRVPRAGKHLYSEKPISLTRDEGQRVLEGGRLANVRVGCAPDTFLGGGLQTCRAVLEAGLIGEPVGANAFLGYAGPEEWHPSPDFFYQPGAGPLFDMGPYYLTALISLFGPITRVTGAARITRAERVITSQPRFGEIISVQTPSHLAGVFDFANRAIATLTTSFDTLGHHIPYLEIYGTDGTLLAPDPNMFDGPISILTRDDRRWREVPLQYGFVDNWRGLGLADLAQAIRAGRPHRANGAMAYHVLDAMQAVLDSAEAGRHVSLGSTCERPAPLPPDETVFALRGA